MMAIRNEVTIDQVLEVLNEAVKADRHAMHALVNMHVRCNRNLLEHPTIECGKTTGGLAYVGLLGILNGLFGVYDSGELAGRGPICAVVDGADGKLVRLDRSDAHQSLPMLHDGPAEAEPSQSGDTASPLLGRIVALEKSVEEFGASLRRSVADGFVQPGEANTCELCAKGFPIERAGYHVGKEALGMIPPVVCQNLRPAERRAAVMAHELRLRCQGMARSAAVDVRVHELRNWARELEDSIGS